MCHFFSFLSLSRNDKRIFCLAIVLFASSGIAWCGSLAADVVDFEDLVLSDDSYFDGYGVDAVSGAWQSGGAGFNTRQFGPGWSYSNVVDTSTSGFDNQWASFAGGGFGGSENYALATSYTSNGAVINLEEQVNLVGVQVTNATYTAISMRDGDSFAKKFGGVSGSDPDYFSVTFTGFTEADANGSTTGNVVLHLADFRFEDDSMDYILDQWTDVDLTSIGPARSIGVSFDGSDVGQFGLNTPAYVAIDSLSFSSIPEPSSYLVLLGLGAIVATTRGRRPFVYAN